MLIGKYAGKGNERFVLSAAAGVPGERKSE